LGIAPLTGIVVMLTMGLTAVPAGAAAPRDQGWWTVTNPGIPGAPAPVPAPPDVPAGGLLIQGGGGGAPTAFAALLYELDPGTTAGTLTLAIAPNSGTTPSASLELCPLIQAIVHPEQGGPMTDAPPYDCARKVTAAPDSNTYRFAVSGLVSDRLVAVAILPIGPLDRVVLNAPDSASLATEQGATSATPDDSATALAPAAEPAASPEAFPGTLDVGSPSSVEPSLPGVATAGPSSVAPTPASVPAGRSSAGSFIPAVSAGPEEAAPLLVLLLVAGTLGGAGLWTYAGRQRAAASEPA
jgi:hypothetical protein